MSDKIGPYTLKKLHAATYGADAYTIDGPTDIMGVWKGSEGAVRIGQMNAAKAAVRRSNTLISALMVHLGDADAMVCGVNGRFDGHLDYVRDVIGLRAGRGGTCVVQSLCVCKAGGAGRRLEPRPHHERDSRPWRAVLLRLVL